MALVRLQGDIVDPRYAAADWRDFQNFVGVTVQGYREEVHFICPRPEDVPSLRRSVPSPSSSSTPSKMATAVSGALSPRRRWRERWDNRA